MKKFLTIVFIALITSGSLFAFNADSAFVKGNEYFRKKDYSKAAEAYKSILASGYEGASVYYNLGNTYFRDGRIGLAILNYERAKKLSPGDEELIHNLKIANFRTLDKVQPVPSFFIFRLWERLFLMFTVSGWTIAAFILYILLLASLAVYFVSGQHQRQRLSFFTGLIAVILFVASIVLLSQRIAFQHDKSKGIITASTSVVKLAPDSQSKDSFVIHEGMKVQIEDKVNEWLKIKIPDGKIGWVLGINVEAI